MSDRGIATLTVVASTKEAQEQLKIFTHKSKSTGEPFSLQPLFPPPEGVSQKNAEIFLSWSYRNWGTKWDAYNSKILVDKLDKFVAEFQIIDGNFAGWLEKVSKDFPELYFYNKYYFGPWEGECLLEGKNGNFINHCYCPSNPVEINSDDLNNYGEFALLTPKDANGKPYPFTLININSSTILVLVRDVIFIDRTSKIIDKDFYREILFDIILRIAEEKNFDAPINLDREDDDVPVLEYSFLVNCQTVQEAIEKALQRIDEFHKPITEFINQIKRMLTDDLKIDKRRFEIQPPSNMPIKPLFKN